MIQACAAYVVEFSHARTSPEVSILPAASSECPGEVADFLLSQASVSSVSRFLNADYTVYRLTHALRSSQLHDNYFNLYLLIVSRQKWDDCKYQRQLQDELRQATRCS